MNTNQTTELLRAASVITAKFVAGSADGNFGWLDKANLLLSIKTIWQGISGVSEIGGELQDLDQLEVEFLIAEIKTILEKTGKFTHRERDVAERILRMVYRNVVEASEILKLPPTALPA